MTVRIAAVLAAAALAAVAAGCGSSSHVSAGATATVAGTTYATTVGTTTSTTVPAPNRNACATLRSAASRASSSVLAALPSFLTVRSRSQLVGKLTTLQHRLEDASSNVAAVSASSPPLVRDKQQLASALQQLSQQVGSTRTAVQNGNAGAAKHLASTQALHRLQSASSDLASRCAG